jgi:phosphoglycolate phosphatase-like HAD superfamily hydrolase
VAEAARQAGLSLVVGVGGSGRREALARSGSDIVLDDLDQQVSVADLA